MANLHLSECAPIVVIVNGLAVTPIEIAALTKIVRYPQLEKERMKNE